MGVARREPQAWSLPAEQGSVQREKRREPKLEALLGLPEQKREQRQLALQVLGSPVLMEPQSAQRVPRALQRPACVRALRAMEQLPAQQQARRKAGQRALERLAAKQAADGQLLRPRREIVFPRLPRTRRPHRLALVPEWCCEPFQQHRPG